MFPTAPPQRTQPDALDVVPECFQRLPVGRDGAIGEEASDDLLYAGAGSTPASASKRDREVPRRLEESD
jgi:hypothetical protein